jgi:FixJ family two-component response regulator
MAGVTSVSPGVHIVDDDASFPTATGRLLRVGGYAFEEAEDGALHCTC